MGTDCSFRLGNLSCDASNFVMASLGVLVCFLAALIVFSGLGLLVHFVVVWVNRRRLRNLTGEPEVGRIRAFLSSLLGPNANGPSAAAPVGPRTSRLWNHLNLLGDTTPPPSYADVMAMGELAGNAHGTDADEEPDFGNADEPEGGDGESVAVVHVNNGDIGEQELAVGIWV